jgi:hypothetical protein
MKWILIVVVLLVSSCSAFCPDCQDCPPHDGELLKKVVSCETKLAQAAGCPDVPGAVVPEKMKGTPWESCLHVVHRLHLKEDQGRTNALFNCYEKVERKQDLVLDNENCYERLHECESK